MTNIDIGKRIESVREEQHYSLDEVASRIGVAASTVQRYEKGKIATIKLPVIEAIAKCLGVNPAWLIGKSDVKVLPKPVSAEISTVEIELLKAYRDANEHIQYAVRKLLDLSN